MKNKDIVIYCAGDFGKRAYLQLTQGGYHVVCFCESSADRSGESIVGTPIYSYEETKTKFPNASYVIANSIYANSLEIGRALESDGYMKDESYYIFTELVEQGIFQLNTVESNANVISNSMNSNIRNVDKILFLLSSPYSGTSLIDGMLDGHPNIMFLGMNQFSVNLMKVIKRAAAVKSSDIVCEIVTMVRTYMDKGFRDRIIGVKEETEWIDKFEYILNTYIDKDKTYSEKDIFLAVHWAHYETFYGKYNSDIEPIIYLEIHEDADRHDVTLQWVTDMGFDITLLKAIRRSYMSVGSVLKAQYEYRQTLLESTIFWAMDFYSSEYLFPTEKDYPLIRYRFEDLKLHPKEILHSILRRMNIPWSENLMQTTEMGKQSSYVKESGNITGLDPKPVYYSYDEYFDAFDKFRLDVLFWERSKAYGYSYTEKNKYPISIEEMGKLFCIPFKFEEYMTFPSEEEREKFRKKMELLCTNILKMQEQKDIYKERFQFGPYLQIQKE